jgi:hypothetical protein
MWEGFPKINAAFEGHTLEPVVQVLHIEEGVEERQMKLLQKYLMKKLREREMPVEQVLAGGYSSSVASTPCDAAGCSRKLTDTFMLCNWCGHTAYCSKECQESDWDRHITDELNPCPGPTINNTSCSGVNEQEAVSSLFDAVCEGVEDGAVLVSDVESLINFYESNDVFKKRNAGALDWLHEVQKQLLTAPEPGDSDSECDAFGMNLDDMIDEFIDSDNDE